MDTNITASTSQHMMATSKAGLFNTEIIMLINQIDIVFDLSASRLRPKRQSLANADGRQSKSEQQPERS